MLGVVSVGEEGKIRGELLDVFPQLIILRHFCLKACDGARYFFLFFPNGVNKMAFPDAGIAHHNKWAVPFRYIPLSCNIFQPSQEIVTKEYNTTSSVTSSV